MVTGGGGEINLKGLCNYDRACKLYQKTSREIPCEFEVSNNNNEGHHIYRDID